MFLSQQRSRPARAATCAFLTFVLWTLPTTAAPQDGPSRDDIETLQKDIAGLRAGMMQLRRDIARVEGLIHELAKGLREGQVDLGAPPPALDVRLTVAGEPFLGRVNAPITIFEFSDYE